jgi:hypothetical protein
MFEHPKNTCKPICLKNMMFPNNAAASEKLRGEARASVESEDLGSQPAVETVAEEISGVAGETVDEDQGNQPVASQNVMSTIEALDSSQNSDTTLQMGQFVESHVSETELEQSTIVAGCPLPPLPSALTLATLAAASSLSELDHDNVDDFIALMHCPPQNPPDAKRRILTKQSSDTRMTDVSDDEPIASPVDTPILPADTPQVIQFANFQGLRGRGERIQDSPSILYVKIVEKEISMLKL